MRFLAYFGQHPWLRTGLVLFTAAAVLYGGARVWTSGPDTVHITITSVNNDGMHPATRTVTFDRTMHDGAVAQRLQRDLAGMPISDLTFDLFATNLCIHVHNPYDIYALTWYRAGLPVEQASSDPTGCGLWQSDGVFVHEAKNANVLYADIATAAGSGG